MKSMLIVDDEPKVCECLKTFFNAQGFSAACAYSGEEALDRMMADQCLDLVLLDIGLPGISGIEVLKRVKDMCPTSRVVMVTAMNDDMFEEEARAYGADAYITKPFDFSPATWSAILDRPQE